MAFALTGRHVKIGYFVAGSFFAFYNTCEIAGRSTKARRSQELGSG
ncbi:hypothetical protein [Nonomuraea endophytica]